MRCRACGGERTKEFLDLGEQPLANRLLSFKDLEEPEPRYPLALEYCEDCAFVQLSYVVPPEEMFSDYLYATGTSSETRAHFERLAEVVLEACGLPAEPIPGFPPLVVDVGSNDGTLLGAFRRRGARVLGIEPAANLAKLADGAGIPTLNAYFDDTAVLMATRRHGQADVITACNVFTHVDDVRGFLRRAKRLLAPDGTLVLEIYYLWDLLKNGAFDQVYHEHLSYFSLNALLASLEGTGLVLWHVETVPVQGGSLRAFISPVGTREPDDAVRDLAREEPARQEAIQRYKDFARKVGKARTELQRFFNEADEDGLDVAGYGAAAKASVLCNYVGAGPEDVRYIVDLNPMKQGKFLPGVHIPIVGPRVWNDSKDPDVLVIFPWNLADEVVRDWKPKLPDTTFVVPCPRLAEVG